VLIFLISFDEVYILWKKEVRQEDKNLIFYALHKIDIYFVYKIHTK